MQRISEKCNDVKNFKNSDSQQNCSHSFYRLDPECRDCSEKKPHRYEQCLEMKLGEKGADQVLGIAAAEEALTEPEPQAEPEEQQEPYRPREPVLHEADFVERELGVYDLKVREGLDTRGYVKQVLEENERLKRRNWKLSGENKTLRVSFNQEILRRYPKVVAKYSLEIMVHQCLLHMVKRACREAAKEEGLKEYQFLWMGTAKQLAEMFGLKRWKNEQVVRNLGRMGAWEKRNTLFHNVGVYYLGERWRNKRNFPLDYVLFNLRNQKTRDFFDKESRGL